MAAGAADGIRVLVMSVVHDPEDARIRYRQIPALLEAGATLTYAAPFSGYERTPPVGVEPIDLPRALGRHRVAALHAARRTLRAHAARHDVVIIHDPELLPALLGGTARGVPVVWDVHEDTAAAVSLKPWLPGPLRPIVAAAFRVLERAVERRVGIFLAEEGYRERFRDEHPVVPNSVLVPGGPPRPPGADRAVYVGRLTAARGARELIAVGRALRGRIGVELIGPADADVRQEIQDAHAAGDVHWTGFLPNDQALARVPGALCGLSLLHDEANYAHSRPTKVMEYMAGGVPVITTPNRASVDLIQRYDCGIVVGFGDVAATVEAVDTLREDAGRREHLGEAGRRAALTELSWSSDAPAFVEAVRRHARSRPRRPPA